MDQIQQCIHRLEGQDSTPISLFDENDEDYDSDDEDPNLEDDLGSQPNQLTSQVTLGRSGSQANPPGQEEKALEDFLEQFDFKKYSKDLVIKLSSHLLDLLISTIQKEVIGQFDHELITFHAIWAMNFETKSFKSPSLISQAYSAMVYIFQLVIVEASSIGKGMFIILILYYSYFYSLLFLFIFFIILILYYSYSLLFLFFIILILILYYSLLFLFFIIYILYSSLFFFILLYSSLFSIILYYSLLFSIILYYFLLFFIILVLYYSYSLLFLLFFSLLILTIA